MVLVYISEELLKTSIMCVKQMNLMATNLPPENLKNKFVNQGHEQAFT